MARRLIIFFSGLVFQNPAINAFVPSPLRLQSYVSSTTSFRLISAHNSVGSEDNGDTQCYPFSPQKVALFESILRDGEQGARKTLTPEQKGRFAFKLEEQLGPKTVIDAGLPGASPLDFSGVQNVVQNTHRSILSVLAHGTPTEIAVASRALIGAQERSRISTFHRPMEVSRRYIQSNSKIQKRLLKQARRAVSAASDMAPEVQYYLVYAGNRDPNFLAELAWCVADAGATQVVIADSQSGLTPSRAHKLTMKIKEAISEQGTTIAIHCHNQMGLALPNTLAAIGAGATQVESCLLGVGDAGGNLATEQFLAYCQHSRVVMTPDIDDDELFPTRCSVLGDCSLPASVSLAQEVAQMMEFEIGENQPMVGERAFTCTTGIHQDNIDHLGHTSFQPQTVGREWSLALNRHSSQKSVHRFLSRHLGSAADKDLAGAFYSYLSYQVGTMEQESILEFCNQLLQAHDSLCNKGVVICPTTVGYTLITTQNIAKMESLKGRPNDKPCGILGIPEIYKATFGTDPPIDSDRFVKHIVGYLGRPSNKKSLKQLPREATMDGFVGIWLECGPVVDYLAKRLWSESQEVIVATSCNMAGEGNPQSDRYDLLYIDDLVRNKVDFEISFPHWETPDLDENGRWLSAPIWDLEKEEFVRDGRNQEAVESLLGKEEEEQALEYRAIDVRNSTQVLA